jgi:hypothetical protein
MDPFRLCIALGPVAVYLLLLGVINLSRRAFLVSGTRDAAALGLAVSGFVLIGPVALFLPEASLRIGPYVWGLLAGFYGLSLVLVLLVMRPRIVVYNISAEQLRPILAELVERLDPGARWAGDGLVLPGLGVQLHTDPWLWMRNVSLVSAGPNQDYTGWRRLESALAVAVSQIDAGRNPRGVTLMSVGVAIVGALVWTIYRDPQAIARALSEMVKF